MESIPSALLMLSVSSVEIYRLKAGEDHVYLHTNIPSPRKPYVGGVALHLMTDRGLGEEWVHLNFPGVETHVYDHTIGRRLAHNPVRTSVPNIPSRYAAERAVVSSSGISTNSGAAVG